jgi:hypothetical protein
MKRIETKGMPITVYETAIEKETPIHSPLIQALAGSEQTSSLTITNRRTSGLS